MIRTAILVSGGGSNLQAILDSMIFGEIPNCEIVGVVSTNPNAHALERAKNANIPTYVVDQSIFPNIASFTEGIIRKLEDLDTEFVVLAGYAPQPYVTLVRKYRGRIINIQPSLMPAFCEAGLDGMEIHEAVLAAGCKVTGATAYFVSKEPHKGPIILQKAIEIMPEDTASTLQRRVMEECEWELLPKALALYCDGKLEEKDGIVKIK